MKSVISLTRLFLVCLLLFVCLLAIKSHQSKSAPASDLGEDKDSYALLPISQDFRWGYINRAGEIVIKPQFDSAEEFSEGLAYVTYPPRQKPMKPGDEHPELVGGKGYIDQTGKVVLEIESPLHLESGRFREGLAIVWTWVYGKGSLYGSIDKSGTVIIKPQFSSHYEFYEGLAAACVDFKCGFIDKTGTFVIPPKFRMTYRFFEGMAAVELDQDKVGFVNKSGEMIGEPVFASTLPIRFSEGLAAVAYPSGKFGYIGKDGLLVIPMQFDLAFPFSEGLAPVSIKGKWGYIDKSGKFVIEPQFRFAGDFSEGLAPINAGSRALARTAPAEPEAGYIDKTGKIVIPPQFDSAGSFVNGIAKVEVDGKWGYIDRKGNYIWKPTR